MGTLGRRRRPAFITWKPSLVSSYVRQFCRALPPHFKHSEKPLCLWSPPGREPGDQMALIKKFLRDESGATAIEYGLIAAGISIAIIAVVKGLGSKLKTTFTSVQNALN
jgi:pilus assembly protein Flp/PilA